MTEATEIRSIDADKALELLHQAVTTRGTGFNYRASALGRTPAPIPVCRYEYDGRADCVVGTALSLFDVPLSALQALDAGLPEDHEDDAGLPDGSADASIDSTWARITLEQRGHVRLTRAAALVFRAAQQSQDSGNTWGHAESAAIELAERLDAV